MPARARAPAASQQGPTDAREPRCVSARRAAASVGRRGRLWWYTAAEPTQRRSNRRLNHAWRRVCACQRLRYLGRDLRRPESRAARVRGAQRPRRGRMAALGAAHSVTGEPPPPSVSRLAACLRALVPAAPRQGPIDAHEPCCVGAGRAAASVGRRSRLLWCTSAEPTQRRSNRRLYHAWRLASVRQRLY